MTGVDVRRIFAGYFVGDDTLRLPGGATVTTDAFLHVAGFSIAPDNPTKPDLHNVDAGEKGYAAFIELGKFN